MHKVNGKLTNREHKDVKRLARDRSLLARLASVLCLGEGQFFPRFFGCSQIVVGSVLSSF